VRIFHANLLYENTRTAEMAAAVADVEADVLAFAEYTPEHAAALHDRLPDEYPHRVEYAGTGATGSALWSRYPLTELPARPARAREILAIVGAPEPLAVYLVHPTSPLVSIVQWRQELAHLHDPPLPSGPPVAVVGDLNAAYWHPAFRAVLRRGWRDAHHVMRRGFSASWRNDVRPLPNFVRLDHALVRETLVVAAVDDVHVPGSDHVGFVVTVSPASRG
jgi:endonuclease/exonuclease/phosphatase (EEP) superfamily protein YafD